MALSVIMDQQRLKHKNMDHRMTTKNMDHLMTTKNMDHLMTTKNMDHRMAMEKKNLPVSKTKVIIVTMDHITTAITVIMVPVNCIQNMDVYLRMIT